MMSSVASDVMNHLEKPNTLVAFVKTHARMS